MASKDQDVTLQVLVPKNAKPGDKLKEQDVTLPDNKRKGESGQCFNSPKMTKPGRPYKLNKKVNKK